MNLHAIPTGEPELVMEFLRADFPKTWRWEWHNDHPDYFLPGTDGWFQHHMGQGELRDMQKRARDWDRGRR